MELVTWSAEALIKWNKWSGAWNQFPDYCHVKMMNNFGHYVDEEEDGSSEYE